MERICTKNSNLTINSDELWQPQNLVKDGLYLWVCKMIELKLFTINHFNTIMYFIVFIDI